MMDWRKLAPANVLLHLLAFAKINQFQGVPQTYRTGHLEKCSNRGWNKENIGNKAKSRLLKKEKM